MKEFKKLVEVADKLNDPTAGCPWDIKQTFKSLQKYILEEACELVDAVDDDDDKDIVEELGDYLYVVIFYAKVAEREKRFTLADVVTQVKDKLIRRHPHVFGDISCETSKDVEKVWNEVKALEKSHRKSALDGIPRSLLALARAQRVLSKLIDHEYENVKALAPKKISEGEMGKQFIDLILQAEADGIDAERCLRNAIQTYEKGFRSWEGEKQKNS
ncbi:MAG: Nucleoside triphosphate pyrophosphohydrolase [Chlamydiia bacterium]|nr:Nucleoside triphosphate pyrophosphohydrolase [Chlamydiia bacterium]